MAPVASKYLVEQCINPPIPLIPDEDEDKIKEKGSFVKLDLCFDPRNEESKTYAFNMPVFHRGSPEEWINWQVEFEQVATAIPLESPSMKFSMMRSLLRGDLLRSFNSRAAEVEIETENAFLTCLQDLSLQVFPKH